MAKFGKQCFTWFKSKMVISNGHFILVGGAFIKRNVFLEQKQGYFRNLNTYERYREQRGKKAREKFRDNGRNTIMKRFHIL